MKIKCMISRLRVAEQSTSWRIVGVGYNKAVQMTIYYCHTIYRLVSKLFFTVIKCIISVATRTVHPTDLLPAASKATPGWQVRSHTHDAVYILHRVRLTRPNQVNQLKQNLPCTCTRPIQQLAMRVYFLPASQKPVQSSPFQEVYKCPSTLSLPSWTVRLQKRSCLSVHTRSRSQRQHSPSTRSAEGHLRTPGCRAEAQRLQRSALCFVLRPK